MKLLPYIKEEDRDAIEDRIKDSDSFGPLFGSGNACENAGQLNYVMTLIICGYMNNNGKSYATMNDIVGALENCKNEFQRRIQAPYEDMKIEENGDIYVDATMDNLVVVNDYE